MLALIDQYIACKHMTCLHASTQSTFPKSCRTRALGTTVYFEMLLEAPSQDAKAQWLAAFTTKQDDLSGFNPEFAELVVRRGMFQDEPRPRAVAGSGRVWQGWVKARMLTYHLGVD